jgi:hypothetical protein
MQEARPQKQQHQQQQLAFNAGGEVTLLSRSFNLDARGETAKASEAMQARQIACHRQRGFRSFDVDDAPGRARFAHIPPS